MLSLGLVAQQNKLPMWEVQPDGTRGTGACLLSNQNVFTSPPFSPLPALAECLFSASLCFSPSLCRSPPTTPPDRCLPGVLFPLPALLDGGQGLPVWQGLEKVRLEVGPDNQGTGAVGQAAGGVLAGGAVRPEVM